MILATEQVTDENAGDSKPVENGEDKPEGEEEKAEGDGEKKKKKRNRKKGGKGKQTDPPSVPITDLFPDQVFPEGEIQKYKLPKDDRTAVDRFTSEEKKHIDKMHNDIYNEVRLAAEAHRQTRQHMQRWVSFGV